MISLQKGGGFPLVHNEQTSRFIRSFQKFKSAVQSSSERSHHINTTNHHHGQLHFI